MNTQELVKDYVVNYFSYGVCFVTRKSDGVNGSLLFDTVDGVRHYHGWIEDVVN